MSVFSEPSKTGTAVDRISRANLATDLLLIADLHSSPLERDTLLALWAQCYDGLLAHRPCTPELRDSLTTFCQSLTDIPTCFDGQTAQGLRRDFEAIYGASSHEGHALQSGWDHTSSLDVRHMDAVALCDWGKRRGFDVNHWSEVGRDHLATQLRYLAYLIAADGIAAPKSRLGETLNHQLLHWIDRFAIWVRAYASTPFYQGLAFLTVNYLHEIEGLLDIASGSEFPGPGYRQAVPERETGMNSNL